MDLKYCTFCERSICEYEDCSAQVALENETNLCDEHMCTGGWCCGRLKLRFDPEYQKLPLEKKQKYNGDCCKRHNKIK